jgi:hypothetical protein
VLLISLLVAFIEYGPTELHHNPGIAGAAAVGLPQFIPASVTGAELSATPAVQSSQRRSMDASLHRLANHPYARIARQTDGVYYGPRASVASGQVAPGFAQNIASATTHSPQAVTVGAPSGTYYDYAGEPALTNTTESPAQNLYGERGRQSREGLVSTTLSSVLGSYGRTFEYLHRARADIDAGGSQSSKDRLANLTENLSHLLTRGAPLTLKDLPA